jgi:hypothetical protein
VPRTKENEKAFCALHFGKSAQAKSRRKKKGKGKRIRRKAKEAQPVKPQIWITLLWHISSADALELEDRPLVCRRTRSFPAHAARAGVPQGHAVLR